MCSPSTKHRQYLINRAEYIHRLCLEDCPVFFGVFFNTNDNSASLTLGAPLLGGPRAEGCWHQGLLHAFVQDFLDPKLNRTQVDLSPPFVVLCSSLWTCI